MTHPKWFRILAGVGLLILLVTIGRHGTDDAAAQGELTVDCGAGQSLAQALSNANPGDAIRISGMCTEMVTITTDDLTLDGQGSAVIDGGGGFAPGNINEGVITIDGARRVTLKNLTVQNGPDGIHARRGAAVLIESVTAQDHADEGIQIDQNASAQLTDITVLRNGDNGIEVSSTSSATFFGIILSSANTDRGIVVFNSSSALFSPGSIITTNSNGLEGLFVTGSASLSVRNTLKADRNSGNGIVISNGSKLSISDDHISGDPGTVTVNENGALGIVVSGTSFCSIANSTFNAIDNASDGIGVLNSSSLTISNSESITTNSNGIRGINVSGTSSLDISNSTLNVIGNTNDGIGVFGSSRLTMRDSESITTNSNGIRGINVSGTSSLDISNSTLNIISNTNDGIGIFNSSNLSIRGQNSTVHIRENGDDGISVVSSSSIGINNATVYVEGNGITNSFGDGVLILGTSMGIFSGSVRIIGNQNDRGIILSSSTLSLDGSSSTVLANNGGDGLGIFNLSRFLIRDTSELRIENNVADGFLVGSISIASCVGESTIVLNTNGRDFFADSTSLASTACRGNSVTSGNSFRMIPQPSDLVEDREEFSERYRRGPNHMPSAG